MKRNELNIWFENVHNNKINNKLICLVGSLIDNKLHYSNMSKFRIIHGEIPAINDLNGNYVIVVDYANIKTVKRFLSKGAIVISDYKSIQKFTNTLLSKDFTNLYEIEYDLINPINFEEILTFNKETLFNFIKERNLILEKLFINSKPYKYIHFEIYFNKKILFTEIAIYLYKLATLNFYENKTNIGLEISKIIGTSSKTINLASLNMKLIGIKRVYDLTIKNDIVTEKIKFNIAKKLILLNIKPLHITKIAKIVELPVNDIEKIYTKLLLK